MTFRWWKVKKKNGKWVFRFHILADNGKIIGHEYNSKQSMLKTITEVKRVIGYAEVFPRRGKT